MLLALVVGVGIDWWRTGDEPQVAICAFLAAIAAFAVWRATRQAREVWSATEVEITDDEIRYRQPRTRECCVAMKCGESKRTSQASRAECRGE